MEIQNININNVKPYEKNTKKHPKQQIDNICESLKQFGWQQPIVVDKDNVIIVGHGRYFASLKLGYKEVPCVVADNLTPEQVKKYRLLDNKLNESEWDFDFLLGEIDGLSFDGFNVNWDIPEQTEDNVEVVEVDVPDVPEETDIKLGDIYQLGEHFLMCGDSTSEEDVAKLMDGVKADMVFTDPPYGYEYQSNMRVKSKKFDVLRNDDKILPFMPMVKQFNNGFVFVCTTWKVLYHWLEEFNKYYELSNMIIWDKGGGGIGDLKHTFLTDYEIILCSNNSREIVGKRIGSVWAVNKDNANDYIHATQKPIKLPAIAIENTTSKSNKVLDLFGGSGSTLIACEQLNRKCYMMELDPHYCGVIIKRWEDFTNKKAIKIGG